ncbi:hypothetical protein SAMN02745165_02579 [Malonomonas rubra DSM 5091]|uniref:Uncharacterized protein n=1 Tax=Malonomonas rubra DSM 5091 TaxID=1122189 RepID=A0A1M6JZ93_MALRU|nr:hypothetical protein [Malonomonas rubra]SHJ52023.1 hypothetical protein SAMN02745165_02579 [Malonomonas rubra DSM 5091]
MWKLTIIANSFLMLLFWVFAALLAEPAYNHFVQYADADLPQLPALTQYVLTARPLSLLLPALWAMGSVSLLVRLREKEPGQRREWVQLHSSVTLIVGLLLLILSLTAGILPFLNIGTPL